MSAFDDVAAMAPLRIWEGVAGRVVQGDRISMAVVELEPGSVVPLHHHANEQLGVVIRGTLTFRIGDETREIGAGATYAIPGDVPHEVLRTGPDGAVVLDVFSPPRGDWTGLALEEPRTPVWP